MPGSKAYAETLTNQKNEIARAILKEIRERLGFLVNVGLNYLTMSRAAGTLSGGESAADPAGQQIGSGLTGVLYVLDEPSIGLHQRDNDRLLTTLKNLRDQGTRCWWWNMTRMRSARPTMSSTWGRARGAWRAGGQRAARRPKSPPIPASLTGQYLSGAREHSGAGRARRKGNGKKLVVVGATGNNLKTSRQSFRWASSSA
jgi:excinuclease ABC subunit A